MPPMMSQSLPFLTQVWVTRVVRDSPVPSLACHWAVSR